MAGLLYQLVHVLLYAAVHAIQAQLHIVQGTVPSQSCKTDKVRMDYQDSLKCRDLFGFTGKVLTKLRFCMSPSGSDLLDDTARCSLFPNHSVDEEHGSK